MSQLNETLVPMGFTRRNTTWNRRSGQFIDAVDLQVSKSQDAFTVNAGVAEPMIYEACWQEKLREFVHVPDCIVRVRVGTLTSGTERWWNLEDALGASEAASQVLTEVVPFLDDLHSPQALEQRLREEEVVKRRYPPPIIYLALLTHRRGEVQEACQLLHELADATPSDAWAERVSLIRDGLRCD